MGLRAVTLGHAFEPVVEAAYRQMQLGINFTRPARIEVDLAQGLPLSQAGPVNTRNGAIPKVR
jgi:glutamate-1-semialdehyde aminotransferase